MTEHEVNAEVWHGVIYIECSCGMRKEASDPAAAAQIVVGHRTSPQPVVVTRRKPAWLVAERVGAPE